MLNTLEIAKPVKTTIFSDLDEEFDDTITLFVEETQMQLDRLVSMQSK